MMKPDDAWNAEEWQRLAASHRRSARYCARRWAEARRWLAVGDTDYGTPAEVAELAAAWHARCGAWLRLRATASDVAAAYRAGDRTAIRSSLDRMQDALLDFEGAASVLYRRLPAGFAGA